MAETKEAQPNYTEMTHICEGCKEACGGDNCKLAQSISTPAANKEL